MGFNQLIHYWWGYFQEYYSEKSAFACGDSVI